VLEKVQMPPRFLHCVECLQTNLLTFRAAKGASSGKIKTDVQAFLIKVKFGCGHLPRRCQTKGLLE